MSFPSLSASYHQWPKLARTIALAGLIALLALLFWHVLFIHNFSNAHPRADQWRHLTKIILPWNADEVDAKILWSNHHPNPLLHLYQIFISDPVFGWNVRKDAYFSLGLHVLIFAALAKTFLRIAKSTKPILIFGLVATSIYFFFFQTPTTWLWTLVSLQSLGFALGIIIFLCLARYGYASPQDKVVSKRDYKITFIMALATVFAVLMNFDYGVIFYLSALGAMILVALFHRDKAMAVQLPLYAGLSGLGIVLIKWLLLPSGEAATDPNFSLLSILQDFPDLVKGYLFSLSSAFWGETWFRDVTMKGDNTLASILLTTITTVVFFAGALAALIKGRRGLLFLGLMIYSALFSLAVFTARDTGDFTLYLSAPRYATNFKFAWVGVFLALTLFASETSRVMSGKVRVVSSASILMTVLIAGLFASVQSWNGAKYVRALYDRDEVLLYQLGTNEEADYLLPSTLVGHNRNSAAAVDYLAENELAVFAPNFRAGPLLEEYKALKILFDQARDKSIFLSMRSSGVPKDRVNRQEACLNLEGLATTSPTRLVLTYESGRKNNAERLRMRGQGFSRIYSVMPGTMQIYIQPPVPDVKICASSDLQMGR